jgi:hypothetical protein
LIDKGFTPQQFYLSTSEAGAESLYKLAMRNVDTETIKDAIYHGVPANTQANFMKMTEFEILHSHVAYTNVKFADRLPLMRPYNSFLQSLGKKLALFVGLVISEEFLVEHGADLFRPHFLSMTLSSVRVV